MLALTVLCAVPALAAGGPDLGEGELAEVGFGATAVEWRVFAEHRSVTLTLSTPCGVIQRTYEKGKNPFFSLDELEPDDPDGVYGWEIRVEPVVDENIRKMLAEARGTGQAQELHRELWRKGLLPKGPFIQSGSFGVDRGTIVPLDEVEKGARGEGLRAEGATAAAVAEEAEKVFGQTVISGDLTVYNSLCVGFDCLASESYGSDTIRLKENNLRIHADDTSTAASFPSTDWRIEFNSNLNGGGGYFRVVDASASRNVMTLEAGAPSNALVVDNGGRVGFGTANPVLELHVSNGDTPALRLEQNTSSGFAAQTWDIAGNETSFFIRDASNGSTLPFRIRPGASSNSLVIDSDSQVGVGILSPTAPLHVRRSDGSAQLLVEETSGTEAERTILNLRNNGVAVFAVTDTSADGSAWSFETEGPSFRINKLGSGGEEIIIRDRLDGSGNATMVVNGSVQATNVVFASSREVKTEIEQVDAQSVLERLTRLPISHWRYTNSAMPRRHVGPMAEDFEEVFGLGSDGKTISVSDMNGVALAAIQGLNDLVTEKDMRIQELEQRLTALESRIAGDSQAP